MRRALAGATTLGVLLVSSCRVGPRYERPREDVPATWSDTAATDEAPPVRWWQTFGDPTLDSLVERAAAHNVDRKVALARVTEARALADVARGGARPSVDASASYARERLSGNTPQGSFLSGEHDAFRAGIDAAWEIDLFGRNARAIEAAEANVDAARGRSRAVLVSLLAEVARTYVELRGAQRDIQLVNDSLTLSRDTLELNRARFDAGLASELDVARAQSFVSSTEAQLPALDARVRQSIHRLGILLGEQPSALVDELAQPADIPAPAAELTAGVPSQLARRRPDIDVAERELASATALQGQAVAELFPRLTLTGSFGQQSEKLGDLLDAQSRSWSIGPNLAAPIFHGGALRASVRAQEARVEQARLQYRQTVLIALQEVEDALAAWTHEVERLRALELAEKSDARAVELSSELYERGLADYFDVLDAQRTQLATRSDVARARVTLASAAIALYKALGGGWEDT